MNITPATRIVLRGALVGAVSGVVAAVVMFMPEALGLQPDASVTIAGAELVFSPLTLGPGLTFGLILGGALRGRGIVSWRYSAFVAATMFSYFAAVHLAIDVLVNVLDNIVLVGMAAGAIGATLLALPAAGLLPDLRRPAPLAAMIAAGTLLGATLYFPIAWENFFGWLFLYVPWQAGFTAAMASGFTGRGRRR